jgi:prevent-host-death family protein
MTSYTIDEATMQLSKLVERVERGEEVVIARGKEPVARLVPYVQELPKRGFGSMRGKAWLDESFWEPLPEEELKALGGWLACACGERSSHATLSGL